MGRVKNQIHPVDKHVGEKLRSQRMLSGMSQTELGDFVDLTFQQIQKYERGANRVSASRLYEFCKVFKVPFDFFLQGFSGDITEKAANGMSDNAQASFDSGEDMMTKRETITLVRAYYNIKDEKLRKQLLEMAKTMASK